MPRLLLTVVFLLAVCAPASAHFQMIYTPDAAVEKGADRTLKLVFTHPFEAGHTMDMGAPVEFFMLNKKDKVDLKPELKSITWTSLTNSGKAYELTAKTRKMGDYVFCLIPEPYLETKEDTYLQQITKVIVNNGGLPTNWDEAVKLPAEILPLDKPYALWVGNVFRGVVLSKGKPVPFAQIEVEYMNHPPVPGKNEFQKEALIEAPQSALETQTIKADANGQFVYGIPKSGWWGFAALGVGPAKKYKGKELSQDAIIWVHAEDIKK